MAIKHKFNDPHSDGSDATVVQPSDWNDDHIIDDGTLTLSKLTTIADQTVLGNTSGVTAAPSALSIATILATTPGRYLGRQRFTGNGTYTPTPGTKTAIVRMCGGGGGGGGATATAGVNSFAAGGSSGVSIEFSLTGGISTGGAVSIGTAGTGGTSAGGTGNTGGDTKVVINGTTYTAKGGTGGVGSTASGAITVEGGGNPQSGSSSVGQQIAMNGQDGVIFTTSGGGGGWQGRGGASLHGLGGQRASTNSAPSAPAGFGGGGAGAAANNGSAAGGPGSAGILLIDEYA